MAASRTKNVSLNMIIALICQVVNLLLTFLSRTVFIKVLGANYLGVNGLFTNILSILSFAELGIGNAMVFSMYKPLATRDQQKLGSLMSLYKKSYLAIGGFILTAGLLITPFLDFIIKDKPNISENLYLIYILFLFNSGFSYFFAYKKSIIIADQKNYIVLLITGVTHLLQIVFQIAFLYATHSFILYLVIQILFTILDNIIASFIANKMYPFLKEKSIPLEKSETKLIFKNIRSLAVYKFGSVILNGTDNILISALEGITSVGLVSNYVLLNSACNTILGKLVNAFTASVGNLNTKEAPLKQHEIFNKMFFITAWLYGFASVGLATISQSFIETWLGKDYLLDPLTVIALVSGLYVTGMHFSAYTYRTTLGFFNKGKIAPLMAAILNIALSFLLWKLFGLCGIFIATPIARLLSTGIIDPALIYRNVFHKNPIRYHIMYFGYVGLFALIGFLCKIAISFIPIVGWLGVILKILAVALIFNLCMILIFCKTKMFKDIFHQLLRLLHLKKI